MEMRELDVWLIRGFGALIAAYKNRALNVPEPMNREYVSQLTQLADRMEELVRFAKTQGHRELSVQEIDHWSVECMGMMLDFVHKRLMDTACGLNEEALGVLITESHSFRSAIEGLEYKRKRCENPYEQGRKDRLEGWPARGSQLFGQEHLVRSYNQGYNEARK